MSNYRRWIMLVGLAAALCAGDRPAVAQQRRATPRAEPKVEPELGPESVPGPESGPPSITGAAGELPPPELLEIQNRPGQAVPEGDDTTPAAPAPEADSAGPAAVPAPVDEEVIPTQAPPAAPAGDAPPAPAAAPGGLRYAIDPASVPVGPAGVAISVQVIAPQAMNLHKQADVTIVVKNTGQSDAHGVLVRDQLPEGVKFIKSLPPTEPPAGGIVKFELGTLPAGSEKKLVVTVEPIANGPQDHVATVMLSAGSRAKSVVLQPRLRIEQTVNRTQVLKGQQVRFDITVTNDGDGPARGVMVRADLSNGLKHPDGRVLELELASSDIGKAVLAPRESIRLPELIVDAVEGGEQTCTLKVTSPDVVDQAPEAHAVKSVTVVEPKLKLDLKAPPTRYTDSVGEYTLTLQNPGTAPAIDVRVAVTFQGDGQPYRPQGATWDARNRQLVWTIPQLDPGGKEQTFQFRVRYGGLGTYTVNAQASARGGLREVASGSTSIEGTADLELHVTEELRIIDVEQETIFHIKIRNLGTKEARRVQVNAKLSANLTPVEAAGTEDNAVAGPDNVVSWPEIDRIPPSGELELGIRTVGKAPGLGSCRVYVSHEELTGPDRIEDVANVTVAGGR